MRQLDSADAEQVEAAFLEAIEQPTASQRAEFVDTACSELRQRVEALLRAHNRQSGILDGPLVEFSLRSGADDASPWSARRTLALDEHPAADLLAYLEPLDGHSGPGADDALNASNSLGTLGPYEVEQVIGRGGMGIVLRARDSRLGRTVALKVLAPVLAANDSARRRFLREARAAAAVRHDHVVTIHAIEEHHGLPLLVLEYLADGSLEEWIARQGPLDVADVVRLGVQIASGLAAAHQRGIVHRDLKPANILLENGLERARITDFGIARAVGDVGVTSAGIVIGTPLYMSPEQAAAGLSTSGPEGEGEASERRRQSLDQRSDLFGLGSLLYAMCAGRPPFSGETPLAVLRSVCENAPPPLRELQPETPAWLEHVILRLLEKDPARRYQSAAEVAAALEHGEVAVPTVIAQPVASVTPTPKRTRAWLTIALALAAVTLTTTAALIGASRGWSIAPSANEVSTPHAIPNPDEVAPPDRFAPPPAIESSKLYGEIGRMQFPGKINSLDLSPDGKLAYVAVDKLVHVCDLDQQREIGQFPGHTDVVAVVAVAPDGARIATGAFDRTLRIWNAADRRQLVQVDLPVGVRCAAFSPDGRQVLVSFSGASPNFPELGSLTIFDAETGNVVRKLTDDMGEAFWSVAWSPAGTHVAAGNYLDQLALFETARFDTPTRGQTRIASHRGPVYALRFSSDGARLYSGAAGGFVNCWNMADHSRLHRWEIGQPVKCIDLGSGESRLLLGGTIDVRVFDTRLAGEQAVTKLPGHTGPLTGLRFDRDDGRAVSASADGTLRLWKLPPRE